MSTGSIYGEGLDKVLARLNTEVMGIKRRSLQGLIKVGFLIQRESQKLTPVQYGNLKASAFTVWRGGGGAVSGRFAGPDASSVAANHAAVLSQERAGISTVEPEVEVGYSAAYAIYVHENTMASHTKSKSGKAVGARGGKLSGGRLLKSAVLGAQDLDDMKDVGEAKFLEKAIDRNMGRIVDIIRNEAEIK